MVSILTAALALIPASLILAHLSRPQPVKVAATAKQNRR